MQHWHQFYGDDRCHSWVRKMWWDRRRRKFKGGCGSIRVGNGNQWEAVLINKSSYDTSFDGKVGDEVEFLKVHEGNHHVAKHLCIVRRAADTS